MAERSHDELVLASIFLCVPSFFLCVELFWMLHERYPELYYANEAKINAFLKQRTRRSSMESDEKSTGLNYEEILWHEKSEPERKSFISSVKKVWEMSFHDLEEILGFDASVFCNLLWYQFLLFLFLSVPVGILIPIYCTGESPDSEPDIIDMMSLTNVKASTKEEKSWRLWFTFCVASAIFLGCAWFIQRSYRALSARADRWNSKKTEARRTVLITRLLKKYQDRNVLHKYLNSLFPGEVANVRICKNLLEIQHLWDELDAARLEREMCESMTVKVLGCCCWKRAHTYCVDREKLARDVFYSQKIQDLKDAPAAVVLFRSMKSAAICCNMVISPCGKNMKTRALPESRDDVCWVNLSKPQKLKKAGRYFGWGIFLTTMILFSSCVTAIQGLAHLEVIEKKFFGGKVIVENELVRAAVQGALPPAMLNALFAVVPICLFFLSWLSFVQYRNDRVDLNLRRYADMLIGGGLLVLCFSSSIFSLTEFKIKTLWRVLGDVIPHQSVFFLSFTITSCFLSLGLEFGMFLGLALHLVGVYAPKEPDWPYLYGMNIYMFTICITYAVVAPLIVIFGCLYFLIAYMVYTYQLLYVYKRGSDSGGTLFPTVYSRLSNGLLIGELVVLAMLVLKEAIRQAVFFVGVTVATSLILREGNGNYKSYFGCASLESIDRSDRATVNKETRSSFVSPAFEALEKHHISQIEKGESSRSAPPAAENPWLGKESSNSFGVSSYTEQKEEKLRENGEHAKSE